MKILMYFVLPFPIWILWGNYISEDSFFQMLGSYIIFIIPLLLCGLIAYYFFIKPIFFD
jgi:hypothetical protein